MLSNDTESGLFFQPWIGGSWLVSLILDLWSKVIYFPSGEVLLNSLNDRLQNVIAEVNDLSPNL